MKKNTKIAELEQLMKEQREKAKQKKAELEELQGQLIEINAAKAAAQMSCNYDVYAAKETEAAEISKQIAFIESYINAAKAGEVGVSVEDIQAAWRPRASELTAELAAEYKKVLDEKQKYINTIREYAQKVNAAKNEYAAAKNLLPKKSNAKLAKVDCADINDMKIDNELKKTGEINHITEVLRRYVLVD